MDHRQYFRRLPMKVSVSMPMLMIVLVSMLVGMLVIVRVVLVVMVLVMMFLPRGLISLLQLRRARRRVRQA